MATQTAGLEMADPQPSFPGTRPLVKPRLAYLDNVRTVLITAVVLGHLSVTYGFVMV